MLFFNRFHSKKLIYLWFSETLILFVCAALAAMIRFGLNGEDAVASFLRYDPYLLKSIAVGMAYVTTFYYFDLYTSDLFRPGRLLFIKLLKASIITLVALFALFFVFPAFKAWRGILLIDSIIVPLAIMAWRGIIAKLPKTELPNERVLIIGSGDLAKKIGTQIYHEPAYGFNLVGFIDDDPAKFGISIVNPGIIGGYGDITKLTEEAGINRIIVALADRRAKLPMATLLDCKLRGIIIEEGETFNEKLIGKIPVDHLKPSWMVFSDGFKSLRSRKTIKRIFDVCMAVCCLIVSSPVMLLTAALIKLESRGPVLFRQTRVGENGKHFDIFKFRSMRADAEQKTGPVWAGTNDNRVTKVGKIIRVLRIDELPQIFNVLRGDMSFVGPRPERPFFVTQLREVIPYYELRTVVKPGITGWAQIKYPYGASVEDSLEKLQYDIFYIKNMSPLLDIMIFFWTIKVVLTGKGAR